MHRARNKPTPSGTSEKSESSPPPSWQLSGLIVPTVGSYLHSHFLLLYVARSSAIFAAEKIPTFLSNRSSLFHAADNST
eukprot:CAMPEP_0197851510 /NCGR_PEP_ID=MMETSP1438-20131217/18256_1 /TAXON_ID=1461541 /ORGANISM="Pterosperma sp., Strain CCMP1384" /LENGTH=78 /DNA_ID=CAMNT_0043465129 /DNA_START=421 /DNA_END=657 /DNA_ORIENTATION=+